MEFEPIETENLRIRPYQMDDLQARHQLMTDAIEDTPTLDETRQWLEWTIASYRELDNLRHPPYGDYAVVLRHSNAVIGSVGLVPTVIPWKTLELGQRMHKGKPATIVQDYNTPEFGLFWAILPTHQGYGYATEAAKAFVRWIFDAVYPMRLVATTENDNTASIRVMHKLGMKIMVNRNEVPFWLQTVGVLVNPD